MISLERGPNIVVLISIVFHYEPVVDFDFLISKPSKMQERIYHKLYYDI
jgi:hypothetical protein